jgi:hypothetical protein
MDADMTEPKRKKRRKARIKTYSHGFITNGPGFYNESGEIDGEKLGQAMLSFVEGVLAKVKARQAEKEKNGY